MTKNQSRLDTFGGWTDTSLTGRHPPNYSTSFDHSDWLTLTERSDVSTYAHIGGDRVGTPNAPGTGPGTGGVNIGQFMGELTNTFSGLGDTAMKWATSYNQAKAAKESISGNTQRAPAIDQKTLLIGGGFILAALIIMKGK